MQSNILIKNKINEIIYTILKNSKQIEEIGLLSGLQGCIIFLCESGKYLKNEKSIECAFTMLDIVEKK